MNTEPLTAIFPNGHMKYGNIMWNILEVLQIVTARNVMRVKVSKNARATRSLLKVLRRCICMRIMIIMAFPKIPKTAMVSLVKRSIHDDHSSYSSFTELPHPWFVTLFVRILAYLDHAALVLIFGSANNVTLLMVSEGKNVWNSRKLFSNSNNRLYTIYRLPE